ncbi:MAG: M23 family metallopeptidase [Kangiellaceae bacterium]|nr:M23 family metallopeptidase [Kangiellaceae bacterium]
MSNKKQIIITILFIALLFSGVVITLIRFNLSAIPEPWRLMLWDNLTALSITVGLLGIVTYFLKLSLEKPSSSPVTALSIIIFTYLIIRPFLNGILNTGYPAYLDTSIDRLTIRIPMDGKIKVAWGGDKVNQNYHAEYAGQRWAYDLIVEPHSHGSQNNEDYGCFGKAVLAPISGEVKSLANDQLDRVPDNEAEDIQNAYGNYIVIKPDESEHRLIIAHLKQGSVTVKKGQFIEEGMPIAQCGNSGNSTEPHVHIHYVALHEANENLYMTGLPLFFKSKNGPFMPVGGYEKQNGINVPIGDIIEHKSGTDD